ncbi:MAG: NusG domain II-containing protein [Firmicutes bacterium]|nr:NusG domain II-containing protein [Bacillota bacterium]
MVKKKPQLQETQGRLTRFDLGLLFLVLALAGVGFLYRHITATSAEAALLRFWDGREEVIDLSQDQKWQIQGKLGPVWLEIKNGQLRVIDSSCPEKICVRSGSLPSETMVIVCVPNGIIIEAERGDEGYDALTW